MMKKLRMLCAAAAIGLCCAACAGGMETAAGEASSRPRGAGGSMFCPSVFLSR